MAGTGKFLVGFPTAGSSHFGPLSFVSASLHFPFSKTIFTPLPPFLFIYLKRNLVQFFQWTIAESRDRCMHSSALFNGKSYGTFLVCKNIFFFFLAKVVSLLLQVFNQDQRREELAQGHAAGE